MAERLATGRAPWSRTAGSIAEQAQARQPLGAATSPVCALGAAASHAGALGAAASHAGALGGAASRAGALGAAASHVGALGGAASPVGALGGAASSVGALGAAISPTGAPGAAASPHGAQGGAATKPAPQAAKQTSQARKVLRAMQRITLPVKLPTREEYSSAASARDQNTAREQRLADITNKLKHLEDTARQVYSCQQPHLPSLPQKGITLSHLKQLCVRLNLATKGAKSRIQCLEAISQHQQQQHQQALAVATITPSKRHAPDSVMRMH
ncbi:hypothetical protein QJQ45_013147 [Haematococcus lacustris]|nr:hypothetical protein QJQ45_013147 [Haematococcus lacustris]